MSVVTEDLLTKISKVIAREVSPETIVLFGSHATGQAHEDSDIDLLIIESEPFLSGQRRRQGMARLWRVLMDIPVAKDILLYSREEVERWRHSRNHVIARALQEGRVLYERS